MKQELVILVGISIVTMLLGGCVEEEVNHPPTADFTWTPENPKVNQTVKFTSTSTDPDGDELIYTWDFGDGSELSSDENPTHIYEEPGLYTVVLTVSDGKNTTNTSKVINIQVAISSNLPPEANFTYTVENLTVYFNDTSMDPDGNISSWLWDFGDMNTSTEQNPVHTYSAPGVYNVTLTVTDDDADEPKTDYITKEITLQ